MEIARMEIVRMGNSPARTHAAGGRPDRASLQWMKTVDESVNPKLKYIKKSGSRKNGHWEILI
jgi:hypothetical protein